LKWSPDDEDGEGRWEVGGGREVDIKSQREKIKTGLSHKNHRLCHYFFRNTNDD
jgi:hypothetical protein